MSNHSCCAKNCKSKGWKSVCKFYTFPTIAKSALRQKWIAAVRKVNTDEWQPKPSSVICSDHFIGKIKSNEEISPAYIPSIFSPAKRNLKNEAAAVNRHARFMKRSLCVRKVDLLAINNKQDIHVEENVIEYDNIIPAIPDDIDEHHENQILNDFEVQSGTPKYVDKEITANIFIDATKPEKSFMCNRYINGSKCDAEVQTDIVTIDRKSVILKIPRKCNKRWTSKVFVDQGVSCKSEEINAVSSFVGFKSITKNEQLLDLAGVSFNNFNFLLRFYNATSVNCKVAKENRLLIFLMKMKTAICLHFPLLL